MYGILSHISFKDSGWIKLQKNILQTVLTKDTLQNCYHSNVQLL